MPARETTEALMRKQLGREVADALLTKIDKMAKEGATPARIEKAVYADLSAHIQQRVVSSVIAKIGPIQPIKVKPISVDAKSVIGPIIVPKVNVGISVKIEPGLYTRGSR